MSGGMQDTTTYVNPVFNGGKWGQIRAQEMPRSVGEKLVRDPFRASLDLFWLSDESRSSLECFCGCLDAYLVLFRCFSGCLGVYFGVVREGILKEIVSTFDLPSG